MESLGVSIFIPAVSTDALQPVTVADLYAYFHQAAKPRAAWRVGGEFEKFGVEAGTGRALGYSEPDGVRAILQALADRFGWEPHFEEGQLTTLTRRGATVSLEPGGQFELSTAPARRVHDLARDLHVHLDELFAVTDPERVAWIAAGVQPLVRVEEVPLMPRLRHKVMAEYLPARSPSALWMMKATASTQATFDFVDEVDAGCKFTTALKLGPIVNALWGNAPLCAGAPAGVVSKRGRVWRDMDPDRSGLLLDLLRDGFSFERWVEYLLDVPMMFTCIDGQYQPAEGRTFLDFLRHGQDGYFPTLLDWELQMTTVFPEVRLKKFLEVRGADAVAGPLAVSVPAFWKGLLYDSDILAAAAALAETVSVDELPVLYESAFRHGLAAEYHNRTLRDWCCELVELASEGLRRQGDEEGILDERPFLDPAREVLDRGRSPGAEFLACHPSPTPADVLRWFAYV
jgi:glutamate--cysteine ligase